MGRVLGVIKKKLWDGKTLKEKGEIAFALPGYVLASILVVFLMLGWLGFIR